VGQKGEEHRYEEGGTRENRWTITLVQEQVKGGKRGINQSQKGEIRRKIGGSEEGRKRREVSEKKDTAKLIL